MAFDEPFRSREIGSALLILSAAIEHARLQRCNVLNSALHQETVDRAYNKKTALQKKALLE